MAKRETILDEWREQYFPLFVVYIECDACNAKSKDSGKLVRHGDVTFGFLFCRHVKSWGAEIRDVLNELYAPVSRDIPWHDPSQIAFRCWTRPYIWEHLFVGDRKCFCGRTPQTFDEWDNWRTITRDDLRRRYAVACLRGNVWMSPKELLFCGRKCCSLAMRQAANWKREQRIIQGEIKCVQEVRKLLGKTRVALRRGVNREALSTLKREYELAGNLPE